MKRRPCRHYSGMLGDPPCALGHDVLIREGNRMGDHWPCRGVKDPKGCPDFDGWTDEEMDHGAALDENRRREAGTKVYQVIAEAAQARGRE